MNDTWTFGIITDGKHGDYINRICESIYNLKIPNNKYEIRIVGGQNPNLPNVIHKEFDESEKVSWITRKKNIIFCESKFENISIGHDYIIYHPDWYKGFLEFSYDWDVSMCKISDINGLRFRDWMYWRDNQIGFLPYSETNQIRYMYISGSYWCAKSEFMKKYQLDDSLVWGKGEDVKWSLSVRPFWNYKMNQNSIVQFIKEKQPYPITDERVL